MSPDPYTAAVGRRLRIVRLAAGLSLGDLKVKSGGRWKAVTVGSYERGDRHMTAENLAAYAKWLGVPVLMFYPGEGDELLRDYLARAHSRLAAEAMAEAGLAA